MVEYGLLLSLIVLAALSGLMVFGDSSGGLIDRSADSIINAG